ncbi:MAG TPA: hypothetical protein VM049_11315 [Gaiellaceae bacterium]|nr:hypothetical protein [Gaiellaceae bacterium]
MSKYPSPRRGLVAVLAGALLALTLTSVAAAAPPRNTQAPTITGTPRVGETLTANNGAWTNSPTAYQYQWQRCDGVGASCSSIPGAVERTYLVTAADVRRTIRVNMLAVNADGSGSARSAPTAVVTASPAPANTARPTITGEARVGEALTAEEGTWTNTPTGYTYQWQRCDIDATICLAVAGAVGKTYGVRTADVGYRLRVTVTARNANGSGAATSALTDIVAPAVEITNTRPTLTIVSVRFLGARIYARFRICDDTATNLTILATDSRPGVASQTRRFSTRIAPNPCGVYTRNWVPAPRFRGKGRYTVTLQARDTSGSTSAPARRTFNR